MNLDKVTSIAHLEDFLSGSQAIALSISSCKSERYKVIKTVLARFSYAQLSRKEKGVVIRFLCKISGYSRQQITRLIRQYVNTGRVTFTHNTTSGFARKYSINDIRLLADMDERYEQPHGARIKKHCERMVTHFGDNRYKHLANISVSHLYNLRQSTTYKRNRYHIEKTRYKKSTIGHRKKPSSQGEPGYLRVDTVHQGDQGREKGVYHINAVDEVTQFEVILSVQKISEHFLIPILEKMLDLFPFIIKGFHSDNGSEYINRRVAALLNKLLIEFTKSRPRQSNDNALVESKNASVVRKIFGYSHIQQKWANKINDFAIHFLVPYVNYHRPCFFPVTTIKPNGKKITSYPYEQINTPYEKLRSLNNAQQYLKNGVSFKKLDEIANSMTDNQAVDLMNKEKLALFKIIYEQENNVA